MIQCQRHDDFEAESKLQQDAIRQLEEGVYFDHNQGQYSALLPFKGSREAAVKKINAADSPSAVLKRLASFKRNLLRFPKKKDLV